MVKYIDGVGELLRLNWKAMPYNRSLSRAAVDTVIAMDEDTRFPVVSELAQIRVRIVLNGRGDVAYLDMSFEEFNLLPESGERS